MDSLPYEESYKGHLIRLEQRPRQYAGITMEGYYLFIDGVDCSGVMVQGDAERDQLQASLDQAKSYIDHKERVRSTY